MESLTEPSQTTTDQYTGDDLIGSPFLPLLVNGSGGLGSHLSVDTSAFGMRHHPNQQVPHRPGSAPGYPIAVHARLRVHRARILRPQAAHLRLTKAMAPETVGPRDSRPSVGHAHQSPRQAAAALPCMIYGSAGQLAHRAHEVFRGGLGVNGGGVDVHVTGEALDQADVARLAIEIRAGRVA
jgi:hypothetical protein